MTASAWVALLVGLAAGNPARRAVPLAGAGRPVVLGGAALAAVALLAIGLGAGGLLEALEISVSTALIGAGLVVGATSLADLVTAGPSPLPGLSARGAAWCPVAFPHLLRPQLAVAALAAGAAHGALHGAIVALVPLAMTVPLALTVPLAWRSWPRDNLVALGRALAALGVLGAADLVLDGVFAV